MKAVYLDATGDPDTLIYGDLPDRAPGPGQVLIKVRAISLNHVDTIIRSGIRPYFKVTPPHVLGGELSGEVLALGANVTGLSPGDRVAARPTSGSYAELAVAAVEATFPLPDSISYEQGAALAGTGATAYRLVVRRARVEPGQHVLVTAAASGTGLFILQIAKAAGARVIATAGGPDKRRLIEEVGADASIDHYSEDVAARIDELTNGQGIDAAIDAVSSQSLFDAVMKGLRHGGRLITYGNIASSEVSLNVQTLFSKGIEIFGGQGGDPLLIPGERLSDTRAIISLAGSGAVRTVIDQVMPLSQAAAAHRLLEQHQVAGKLILVP